MSDIKFYINKNDKTKFIAAHTSLDKEDYLELKANISDGAKEKHVPQYEIKEDKIEVRVGSTLHPMSEEHYIMWIALVHNNQINMIKLKPTDEPVVIFDYFKDSEIYAYCNLHGLWKNIIK